MKVNNENNRLLHHHPTEKGVTMTNEIKQESKPRYPWTCSGRPAFTKGCHCFEPDFEYTWDRVLRMRKEKDPLMAGGRALKNRKEFNCSSTHNSQRLVLGHSHCQYCHMSLHQRGPEPGAIYHKRK